VIQPTPRKLLGAFCLALLVLALQGCGRRGAPELPPDAAAPANAQTANPSGSNQQVAGSPTTQGPTPVGTAPVGPSLDSTMTQNPAAVQSNAPKPSASVYSSFPLDPLLK
jgi:predicted small lipoprotein YifL